MVSLFSKDYSVGTLGGYTIGVISGNVKGCVGPITTHLNYQKADCYVDGGDFVSL